MNENLICLIAGDAPSEQFWRETRAIAAGSPVITSEEWSEHGVPSAERLQGALLRRIDAGAVEGSMLLAFAIQADLEGAPESFRALHAAVSRVHQMSVSLRIFLLVPEDPGVFGRCIPLLEQLQGEFQSLVRSRREFCWVWFQNGDGDGAAMRFAPGALTAATDPLAQIAGNGADTTAALIVAAATPTRFSHWQRLFFDRSVWEKYFTQRAIRDLTDFLDEPAGTDVQARSEAHASDLRLIFRCFKPEPPYPEKEDFTLPEKWSDEPDAHFFKKWLERRRKQMESLRSVSGAQQAPASVELASKHNAALATEYESGTDELKGIVQATAFHEATATCQRNGRVRYGQFVKYLLPQWVKVGNALIEITRSVHPEINLELLPVGTANGDRDLLSAGAKVKAQVTAFLDQDSSGFLECLDRLVGGLIAEMADLSFTARIETDLWSDVCETLKISARAIESIVAGIFGKLAAEKAMIETAPPQGLWRRLVYILLTRPAQKRAVRRLFLKEKKNIETMRQRALGFREVCDEFMRAAIHWAIIQDRLVLEGEALHEGAAPVTSLFERFQARRRAALDALALVPEEPFEDSIAMSFLGRAEMETLYGRVSTIAAARLLAMAAEEPPLLVAPPVGWLWKAQHYFDGISAYTVLEIQGRHLNLGILALECFPSLTSRRLAHITGKAAARLLPLNNHNLLERRILMEWRYVSSYFNQFQKYFEECAYYNEIVAVNRTDISPTASDEQDSMDLYLHLIGFRFQDYRLWRLFSGDAAAAPSDESPSS